MLSDLPNPTPPLSLGFSGVWSPDEKLCFSLLQQIRLSTLSLSSRHLSPLLQIHAFFLRRSLYTNIHLLTLLISSLSNVAASLSRGFPAASTSVLLHARHAFDCRASQDTLLCNSMIRSLVQNRHCDESVSLYRDLRRSADFNADSYTFPFLLKACAFLSKPMDRREGSQLHAHIVRMGFGCNVFVSTGLVDMYVKAGNLRSARSVFDEMAERTPASWTAMTVGYARIGEAGAAMEMFQLTPEKDIAAFNAMINVFVKSSDIVSARRLFEEMPQRNVVSWTTLLSGYCQAGDMISARQLFDEMTEKNLFSWNALIGGYSSNRQPHKALELFQELQSHSFPFSPDKVTLVSIIPAIADLGAMDLGRWIHSYARRKGLDLVNTVCTALIDMYAKCGDVDEAIKLFNCMRRKETASWNALINGLAINGRAMEALDAFIEMQQNGANPDDVTMVAVLTACSHGGLVEEGRRWFNEMENFGIERKFAHYGCFVDILGRGGHLEEAEALINNMPSGPNGIILSSLLFSCFCQGDVSRAERVMKMASLVDPGNVRNYVMMRNLYAVRKRWGDVEIVKGLMRRFGGKEEAGCSAIEVEGNIWEFVAGDRVLPESEMIYLVLRHLQFQMKVQIRDDLELLLHSYRCKLALSGGKIITCSVRTYPEVNPDAPYHPMHSALDDVAPTD
ncbi:pentatricopeptide repeat-containing protein At2g44880 [Dendrobium catenatum]|uniref:pentatricopeptide repeat-containing protein At2g44880 n=1 Tax=Dendrobium catenatum TaxID=906689 RepID=UPI0009F2E564|nr:pentatricopeptide repeat-containing protein At2g44880 [Dendrobium catenatum]